MEKYRSYPSQEAGLCRRIDLAANFRSRSEVLYAANFLFGQLMTEAVAELDYGEAERLNPGLEYPPCANSLAGVELYLMERQPQTEEASGGEAAGPAETDVVREQENEGAPAEDEAKDLAVFSREAAWIAGRISELMQSEYQVYDKETKDYRELRWRDIVILMRSVKGKAQQLLEVLREAGIPCYADMDTGYFRETEVGIIISLLQILDNPRQDIHLAGVLRSPLFSFNGQELALLKVADTVKDRRRDLWDSLLAASNDHEQEFGFREKAAAVIIAVNRWRSLARRRSVAELLWLIYEETGFYDYVGGMPGGAFRQANLRALFDRARQYEATNYRGLFRFLRFIEALTGRGSDLAVARALGENENLVRVMSIHKSKGLEFPVVFVADLGKGINLSDTRELVLCHRDWGIGPYVTLPRQGFRYPTLARWAIAQQIRRETKAEELRILYVALTRAREKLILVGSARNLAGKCLLWAEAASHPGRTLPEAQTAAAKTYLDWIIPALVRHPDGQPLRDLAGITAATSPKGLEVDTSGCHWQIKLDLAGPPGSRAATTDEESPLWEKIRQLQPIADTESKSEVCRILNWRYPFASAASQPAKLTVTEIKRRISQEEAGNSLYGSIVSARPRFTGQKGLTAAQKGTMTHLVMQHLQLDCGMTRDDIGRQIEFMTAAEVLLPEEAVVVDIDAITAFFSDPLGQRLQKSLWMKRELPFSLMLPVERFCPGNKRQ